jgi:hypothetical protein
MRTGIIALALLMAACLTQGQTITLVWLRPHRIGIGGILIHSISGFKTPVVYEVTHGHEAVDSLLPQPMTPRLRRNTPGMKGMMEKIFMKPVFIRFTSHKLRAVEAARASLPQQQLSELLVPMQPYNYALTHEHFTFARTGPAFGDYLLSKHSVISPTYLDVRFAGQMWRRNDTLWFNANSGTYLKKRKKSSGLNPAPEPERMIPVMRSIFGSSVTVVFCNDIAPGFGADEAIDQAEKALKAAKKADAKAAVIKEPQLAAALRESAAQARSRSNEAIRAAKAVRTFRKYQADYLEADYKAGIAAMEAKKARKIIEKELEEVQEE